VLVLVIAFRRRQIAENDKKLFLLCLGSSREFSQFDGIAKDNDIGIVWIRRSIKENGLLARIRRVKTRPREQNGSRLGWIECVIRKSRWVADHGVAGDHRKYKEEVDQ
jgi:hypothetical protein